MAMGLRATPIPFTLVPALAASACLAWWLAAGLGFDGLWAWLLAINASAVPLWAFDKAQSKRRGFRIPEATLHLVALAGAAPMSLVLMERLRHKTLHRHFRRIYWALTVPWAALAAAWTWLA